MDVAAAFEFDAAGYRVPVVVSEPLVEIGRYFKVDIMRRHIQKKEAKLLKTKGKIT